MNLFLAFDLSVTLNFDSDSIRAYYTEKLISLYVQKDKERD